MVTLEQVQLLETKVSRAIEYVRRLTAENTALAADNNSLQKKLETNQTRIDELEVLVMRFKEDQGRIEDGIIAALDRLSQFEEAFENSLKDKATAKKPASSAKQKEKPTSQASSASGSEMFFEISEKETSKNLIDDNQIDDYQIDDDQTDEDSDPSLEEELDIF